MDVNNALEDDLLGLPGEGPKVEVISSKVGRKRRQWNGKVLTSPEPAVPVVNEIPAKVGRPRKPKGTKVDIIPKVKNLSQKELATIVKENKLVKDVFAETFADLQYLDQFSLKTWAMANQTEFYKLAAKLIPVQLTGEGGGPLALKNVTFE